MSQEALQPEVAATKEDVLEVDTPVVEEPPLVVDEAPCDEGAQLETASTEDVATEAVAISELTRRLADEFVALREEFPSLQHPEQLPDAVLDLATEQNISLLDAYLRFRHEERRRIRHEEQRRREATAQSAGSLTQGETDSHPIRDAFSRAFRTALR